MEYSVLAKTGIHLPRISFGTAPLGGVYRKQTDPNGILSTQLIHTAIQNGIRCFDTSPYYGNAECVLGNAIRGIVRERIIICSKGGRISENEFDFSPAGLLVSLERSLRRLNTVYLDIYLLHDIEYGDFDQIMNEALPYLAKERSDGRICGIGFSCFPIELVQKALDHPNAYLLDVVLLYGHHNLINDDIEDIAKKLESANIGLLDASPYAMGLLSEKGPPEWHPATRLQRAVCQEVSLELIKRGSPLCHLALRYALSPPIGSSLVIGIENIVELMDNLNIYMSRHDSRNTGLFTFAKSRLHTLGELNFGTCRKTDSGADPSLVLPSP
jgi:L-galactose dehydrogenase